MNKRVALVPHTRPRVLAVDFPEQEVGRITNLGFDVRRGATGIHDRGHFSIPFSIQDVEIAFVNVSPAAFTGLPERTPQDSSLLREPLFSQVFGEIIRKFGWLVFFIQQGCSPLEFQSVGIHNTGVLERGGMYYSIPGGSHYRRWPTHRGTQPPPSFPLFEGQSVNVNGDAREESMLSRYLHAAKFSILSADGDIRLPTGAIVSQQPLIRDDSVDSNILALKVSPRPHMSGDLNGDGGVLFLPDFGPNNIAICISLLQDIIPTENPNLFDSPGHPWLVNYMPVTASRIAAEQAQLMQITQSRVSELEQQKEEELRKFNWLLGLLVEKGDTFRDCVSEALGFLGFEVSIIDNALEPGERKKEDLHIIDKSPGFFAIGETKSRDRGPTKDFIRDVQDYQARFSRERREPLPNALLFVNHSLLIEPTKRAALFYSENDFGALCREQAITLVDSFALFAMCQMVLDGRADRSAIRKSIEDVGRIIPAFAGSAASA